MVAVSCIPMDVFGGSPAACALALPLIAAPRRDHLQRFFRERWEVEVRNGSEHVVVRTDKGIPITALLNEGIEMAHRALDLISVQDYDNLVTRSPVDEQPALGR